MLTTKTLFFTLVCLMTLAMPHKTLAQNNPQDYVNAHNTARSNVGVGDISWSTTLQSYAKNYANQRQSDCLLINSTGSSYGENLYKGSSTNTGVDAVNAWISEAQYYTYSTNSCATGHICGHYTQVVWKNSTEIGCARVVCSNNAGVFVICNYNPAGNIVGQRPY